MAARRRVASLEERLAWVGLLEDEYAVLTAARVDVARLEAGEGGAGGEPEVESPPPAR